MRTSLLATCSEASIGTANHTHPNWKSRPFILSKRLQPISGRAEAARHGIPMKPTVRDAILPGLQGVALIGEHGDYPTNEKGQKLYPRYELMEQIVNAYRETGRALPMFVDKHFSTDWKKARPNVRLVARATVSTHRWYVAAP